MNYFVTAIGTDSGKTLVSAILCEALEADYWKPVQAGSPRDSDTIRSLVSNEKIKIFPEAYCLKIPASPHAAAKAENIEISIEKFILPPSEKDLIIEGAGGCLVPLNDKDFVVDIINHLNCDVILVANLYLGSINHTLLTIEALKKRHINIKGIIFNGPENPESQRIILKHSKLKVLLHIEQEQSITRDLIINYARKIKKHFHD